MQERVSKVLEKYCSGLWMSKVSEVYNNMFGQKLHPQVLIDLEKWTHICTVSQSLLFSHVKIIIRPITQSRCWF